MNAPSTGTATLPPVKRRNAELVMILVALGISLSAFAASGLALNDSVPGALFGYGVTFGGLALATHMALRFIAPYADPLILPCAIFLNGLGLAMVWRLNQGDEGDHAGVGTQVIWAAIGMALCLAILFFIKEPRVLQRYPYITLLVAIVLLSSPMIPGLGQEVLGARRWIAVGPFQLQPSEFAKLALVVFLSGYLVVKRDVLSLASKAIKIGQFKVIELPRMRDMGPMVVAWSMAILILVGTTDLGTSLLLFGTFLAMIYVSTQRSSWVVIGLLMFMAGATLAWALFTHVQQRVTIWLTPFEDEVIDAVGGSFQLVQGLFALAEGGVLGTGLGQGQPDTIFAADSDLIMVSFGEELGLTGVMAILLVIFLLCERGLRVAMASREMFVKMMAAGISFVICFQVFITMGGVTRLIPLTGMTTPFLSAGGSSLMASWIMLGLLLRMSDNARRPAPQAIQDEGTTQVISR
ncbi:cell division protein FtsW (lipid II flippase) [Lipingzhangella halophila]|uniref:Cell division protein FtsW (Lipid II flippase) n=1 Tax=Lipingzhangella halophila TaxID=1783352 RepID=A0A7W7RPK9_9ACTN|nr:FtsW/RodA/SpoVE family cell cycle protein [Lipingzhangella halophila]MBB4935557.1 cell division protein FtsW (lipid II flippase) [Lipingzhangella halophila]